MPLSALALVLIAALLHASWNLIAKRTGGDHRFAFLTALCTGLLWAPAAWWFGADELPRWGVAQWSIVSASAVIHVAYYLTLLRGYREADLTVVYPVARGSGPLVTVLAAVVLLGERLSLAAGLGVAAVCGGVFLIAGGPSLWRSATHAHEAHDAAARARVRAGLAWGGATGALIAMYSVVDGYAVKFMLMGPVLFDYICNVLRIPLQAPLVWRERATLPAIVRAQWKAVLAVTVMGPLAYILVLYAVRMAPLSHVAPAREVSMLFAALIGGKLLGEADRGLRVAGAACIASGVIALALG
jgi:drug/metabolite transporter (DMT)-like permease